MLLLSRVTFLLYVACSCRRKNVVVGARVEDMVSTILLSNLGVLTGGDGDDETTDRL